LPAERPLDLLPLDLLPLDLLPLDLVPVDLVPVERFLEEPVVLFLVDVVPLEGLEELSPLFFTVLPRDELLLPPLLFPVSLLVRAEVPDLVEVLFPLGRLCELRSMSILEDLLELRSRTRFSSIDPVLSRPVELR
jgi:hypothetical protein